MLMKYKVRSIVLAATILPAFIATAQDSDKEKFLIKASADFGIGNALATTYTIPNISDKSSSSNFGIEFGWRIWQQNRISVEANVGIGYGFTNLNAHLQPMNFHYSAPIEADMDMDPYIRYTDMGDLYQKIKTQTITLPLYVTYRYRVSKIFSLHAFLGFRFGYNFSSKVTETSGNIFSYGIYPQYDDLMIDAPYMNQFGNAAIDLDQTLSPNVNRLNSNLMFGIGAELKIYGPLSIDLSMRYEGSTTEMFKDMNHDITNFTVSDAPVTYTVKNGQKIKPLTEYLSLSKMSQFRYSASLIFRFSTTNKKAR